MNQKMLLFIAVLSFSSVFSHSESLSLAGPWQFQFDPKVEKLKEGAPQPLASEGKVELPGTTDTRGIGPLNPEASDQHLSRTYKYQGAVWFEREVEIPPSWAGQAITLEMERVQWESRVWVDGKAAGMQDSLSVPHLYDLTGLLTPGRHRITVMIDNRIKYVIHHNKGSRWTHAITEETQGNWNGVIGKLELRASPLISIENIQVATLPGATKARATVRINNRTGKETMVSLAGEVEPGGLEIGKVSAAAPLGVSVHVLEVPLRKDVARWDEFSPIMQNMKISLTSPGVPTKTETTRFGVLEFKAGKRLFELNGRPIQLRGNLENAIWPLTGHPPMLPEGGWRQLISTLKEHGMNHLRFHSWCPPEAAFIAADELGLLFQVELPFWDGYGNIASEPNRLPWLKQEALRILEAYGNHPSFRLMSMGNELESGRGDDLWLINLVRELKQADPRILYTSTTHPAFLSSSDDYFDAAGTKVEAVRGTSSTPSGRPGSDNFSKPLTAIDRPWISHEIGQYSMFFNPKEISKYTGTMRPLNLEKCRNAMEKNGLLKMAEPFLKSSAQFQLLLYKQEIERLIATPELAGFQALGIQDYTGQGTAICGFLDAFWDSKGILPASEWRRFCAPIVILTEFPEAVLTDSDTFNAKVKVSNFGPTTLKSTIVKWKITDGKSIVASGSFPPVELVTGKITAIGNISQSLTKLVQTPKQLKFSVYLDKESVVNDWNLWVYSSKKSNSDEKPAQLLVTSKWNQECQNALQEGRNVLLLPLPGTLVNSVATRYFPVFWNMLLFARQPSTIGIHLDPTHPLFAQFPTEDHTDIQWHKLLDSDAFGLNLTGTKIQPLVWLIDDFHEAYQRKLSAAFEAKVGSGRLFVCMLNLSTENQKWPEVSQFLNSLYAYVGSPKFAPSQELSIPELNSLLEPHEPRSATDQPVAGFENFVFRVLPSELGKIGTFKPDRKLDKVIRRRLGFDYEVVCDEAYKTEKSSAWVGSSIVLTVTVPENFKGLLAVHFSDWNKKKRDGHLFFNGVDQSTIGSHEKGRWIFCKIDDEKSKMGQYTLKATKTSGDNLIISDMAILAEGQVSTLAKLGAEVISCDSEQSGFLGANAIDGNSTTFWHTQYSDPIKPFPHELVLRLPEPTILSGITYLPRQDDMQNGLIKEFAIFTSEDGKDWGDPVISGQFTLSNEFQMVNFSEPVKSRYLKFKALSGHSGNPYMSVAEFDIY